MSVATSFKEAAQSLSTCIYADIDLKKRAAQLCLEGALLGIRFRAEIFGDSEENTGTFIVTSLKDAALHLQSAQSILEMGRDFDSAPEKFQTAGSYFDELFQAGALLQTLVADAISIGKTNEIPDHYMQTPSIENPKKAARSGIDLVMETHALIVASQAELEDLAASLIKLADAQQKESAISFSQMCNENAQRLNQIGANIEKRKLALT